MIATRALDSRGIFMVGLSLCAGLATMLMPGLAQGLPEQLAMLAGDGFVVTGVSVMVLNLLFRLGTKRSAHAELDPRQGPLTHQITAFIERQGGAWGARMDIVRRAALAALEASEAIAAAGGGRVLAINGSFDEFNFDLELLHEGQALPLGGGADHGLDLQALMEADDDSQLDAAMQRVSGVLMRKLADKLGSSQLAPGQALLRLHFDH